MRGPFAPQGVINVADRADDRWYCLELLRHPETSMIRPELDRVRLLLSYKVYTSMVLSNVEVHGEAPALW
jgi:hypothetical protein